MAIGEANTLCSHAVQIWSDELSIRIQVTRVPKPLVIRVDDNYIRALGGKGRERSQEESEGDSKTG